MVEIEHVSRCAASPSRVWSVLLDFANHPRWKPIVLKGVPEPGASIQYSFQAVGLRRTVRSNGTIVELDEPSRFAWKTSVKGMFSFEELYEIAPEAGGSRIRHVLRIGGLFGKVFAPIIRRGIMKTLEQSDQRLDRYLRSSTLAKGAKPVGRPPRRSRKRR